MSQGTHHFFFTPCNADSDQPQPVPQGMVIHIELDEGFGDSIQSLIDNGLVVDEVVIQMNAKTYRDPLLMTTLASDNLMVLDTLKDIRPHPEDTTVCLVIQKNELLGNHHMFFRLSGKYEPLSSKSFSVSIFLNCLSEKSLFESGNMRYFSGILRYDPAPDEFQEFDIPVVRTSVSKPRTFKIKARSQEEAESIALDQAGNYEFSESESDYELAW